MLDIANQFGVTENAINYWAKKHGTKTRTMGEIRAIKYWGNSGDSNPMYGKRGEDTPNWKGGVTPMRQEFYRSERWTVAVKAVWKRDAGVCQRCGKKWEHIGKKFHIHHKCSFAIGLETRCDPDNLVLLCQYCHNWVHSSKNTERLFINDSYSTNKLGCQENPIGGW